MGMKKLTRSKDNRVVSGVLGGVGEYLGVDPTAIRLVFLFLLIITGIFPFVILYILAAFIMPEQTGITPSAPVAEESKADDDTAV